MPDRSQLLTTIFITITNTDGSSFIQAQSDWNQRNTYAPDFIRNKPISISYTLPAATVSTRGGVRPDGTTITISGDIISAPGTAGINQLTGDITAGPGNGSQVTTLKNTGTAGVYGDSTHVPQFTTDAKGRVTAVSAIGIAGLTATSMPKASDLGITNVGDQTAALNTIFSNSLYEGIIMDFVSGAAITISGTVNCQGKLILFYPGSYFIGSGTLNNGFHTAGYWQQCFATGVSLTSWRTATDKFSSIWYGTDTTGGSDAQPALQKTSDTMISNASSGMTRTLFMVPGTYSTHTTWMLHDWNGTTYVGQWTLNIEGNWRACFSNNNGYPLIIPNFKTGPVIGVHRALNPRIMGLCIQGQFTSALAYDTFVQTNFTAANSGPAVRDSQYSPYCAICIDPVTNNPATIPPDGGYPTLNGSEAGGVNWYRGTGSQGGSTAVWISNCHIIGFTVDIMNSPNGDTLQGEDCIIEDCFLDTCGYAVAYGQAQNDNCHIYRCRSWDNIFTVIDTRTYGAQKGLAPSIHGYNVAGEVKTLFNIGSVKPFIIENFYAESFLSIGLLECAFSGSTVQGNFNFGISNFTPQYHIEASNIRFSGGVMRYFDDNFNKRIRLFNPQNIIFENVVFDLPPFVIGQQALQQNTVKYINCQLPGTSEILGMNSDMYFVESATYTPVAYGSFKIQDGFGLDSSGNFPPSLSLSYNCSNLNRYINGFSGAVTITVSGTQTASFTVSATNALLCQNNDIVYDDSTNNVIGRISNISGTTITISEIPLNIITGTYTLDLCYYCSAKNNLVGDTASGVATITNVCLMFGTTVATGLRFDNTSFPNGAYVVSYNSSTKVITMSVGAGKTQVRQNFANGYPQCDVRSSKAPNDGSITTFARALLTGTIWTDTTSASSTSTLNKWIFNLGGYLNAAAISLSASYQADYNIQPLWRVNGGSFQFFDNTTDTWTNA